MIKLRHTLFISVLFHAVIFALMSPLVLSMGDAGKKMTEQILVELVEGVSRKLSTPEALPVKAEAHKRNKERVKNVAVQKVQKNALSMEKLIAHSEESVNESISEKEIIEKVHSSIESGPVVTDEEKLIAQPDEIIETAKMSKTSANPDITGKNESWEEGSNEPVAEVALNKSADYSLILDKIEAAKWYPRVARKRGIEGVAVVKFRITPDGNVMDIMIDKASGFSILDNAAIKTIRRAAPFPFFDSLLKVAVTFKLT